MTGLTAEQVAARRHSIGASDVGAVLGLDQYRSPVQVWIEKTGRVDPSQELRSQELDEAALMGHLLEPIIEHRTKLAYEVEYRGRGQAVMIESPALGFMARDASWATATPDRVVSLFPDMDTEWIDEYKTRTQYSVRGFGEPGTDAVPATIYAQVMWQMGVADIRTHANVWVLVDGRSLLRYTVPFAADTYARMFDTVGEWWLSHVVKDVEPPVGGHARDLDYLRQKFAVPVTGLLPASGEAESAARMLAEARAAKEAAEEEETRWKAALMALMGTHTGLHTAAGKVSWTVTKGRERVDTAALYADHGITEDVLAKYITRGPDGRTFRFTPAE